MSSSNPSADAPNGPTNLARNISDVTPPSNKLSSSNRLVDIARTSLALLGQDLSQDSMEMAPDGSDNLSASNRNTLERACKRKRSELTSDAHIKLPTSKRQRATTALDSSDNLSAGNRSTLERTCKRKRSEPTFDTHIKLPAPKRQRAATGVFIGPLPSELTKLIADFCLPSARACLSLTCKIFWTLLKGPENLDQLRLPAENGGIEPPCKIDMIEPEDFHAERWQLLTNLARDKPRRLKSSPTSLKFHGQLPFFRHAHKPGKTCRLPTPREYEGERVPTGPIFEGIVDLCPCIKLTPDMVHAADEADRAPCGACFPAATPTHRHQLGPWGHHCEHDYGDTKMAIHVAQGEVQGHTFKVTTNYVAAFPLHRAFVPSQRLACPHRNVETWLLDLWKCKQSHPQRWRGCKKCRVHRHCQVCRTVIRQLRFEVVPGGAAGERRLACTFTTERVLGQLTRALREQTVFPRRRNPLVGTHIVKVPSPWASMWNDRRRRWQRRKGWFWVRPQPDGSDRLGIDSAGRIKKDWGLPLMREEC